jgi:malonate transporter and related proteins
VAFGTLLGQIGPVFAVILLGVLLSRFDRFGESAAATLNDLVYYLALPALIFTSAATSDLSAGIPLVASRSPRRCSARPPRSPRR